MAVLPVLEVTCVVVAVAVGVCELVVGAGGFPDFVSVPVGIISAAPTLLASEGLTRAAC